jgi:hypothetical protein
MRPATVQDQERITIVMMALVLGAELRNKDVSEPYVSDSKWLMKLVDWKHINTVSSNQVLERRRGHSSSYCEE